MSGVALRRLLVLAGLLALGTFAYVLLAAPIDPERSPRARALTQRPSLIGSINRVRQHLIARRNERAVDTAHRLSGAYPQSAAARLEYAQTLDLVGASEAAIEEWTALLRLIPGEGEPGSDDLNVMYSRARALHALGETARAQELFLACAHTEMSRGQGRSAYNAACYLAMGGALGPALDEWSNALGLGDAPTGDPATLDGWWRVDPDLTPLRHWDRFWADASRAGLFPSVERP